MTYDTFLDGAFHAACTHLERLNDELSRLPEPHRTVAAICQAQGVIDNGGLRYFFENDWPNNPPYSEFADAYERIGCIDAAVAIREASATFGVPDPERRIDVRRDYIEQNCDSKTGEIDGWNDCICGDDPVYSRLAEWLQSCHASSGGYPLGSEERSNATQPSD